MRKNRSKRPSRSYKIGKGRPPLATRWKKGHSGNPRGRPRGSKNLVTFLAEALNEKLQVQEKGKARSMTAREVIVKKIVHAAMMGDLKAANFLLSYEPEISANAQTFFEPLDYIDGPNDYAGSKQEEDARVLNSYLRLLKGNA